MNDKELAQAKDLGVGVLIGLLIAPQSGKDTQRQIAQVLVTVIGQDRIRKIQEGLDRYLASICDTSGDQE